MRIRGLLVVLFLLALAAPAQAAGGASPGAAGFGDRLFPGLGNGGYDVLHYDLDLPHATSAPVAADRRDGHDLRARDAVALALQPRLRGQEPRRRARAGARAGWRRDGQELVITRRRPRRKNGLFVVRVSHFVAVPTRAGRRHGVDRVLHPRRRLGHRLRAPDAEHYVFPSNDHPRDKATFTFRFDVPAGKTAVANGALGQRTRTAARRFVYPERQPMATELIQLAVGN